MTYEEIVAYTKSKMAEVDISGYKGHLAAHINITGEGEGAFYVELNDGNAVVEPYEYFDRDVVLIASADVFIAIVDGKKDAVAAYLTGGLKVEGNIEKAKEFGELLKNSKKAAKKAAAKPAKTAAKTVKPAKTTAKAAKAEKPAKTVVKAEKPAKAEKQAAAAKTVTPAQKKAAVAVAKNVAAKKSTTKSAETK